MSLQEGLGVVARRSTVVKGLLIVAIVVDVLAVVTGVGQDNLLTRAATVGITDAEAAANDARYSLVAMIQLVTFLVCAVAWLSWLHRAYANLQLAGTKRSDRTPGWAVGWWFVPFYNLVRPYQVHRELWRRSSTGNQSDQSPNVPTPVVLRLWWGVFLVSGVLGRYVGTLAEQAEEIPELQTMTEVAIVSDIVGVISALVALQVVARITGAQQAHLHAPEPNSHARPATA